MRENQEDRRTAHYQKVHEYGCRFADFDPHTVDMLLNFFYTHDVIETEMGRLLGAYGLSLSAFNVLMILMRKPGCPLHELGDLLLVSRANVTGLVDCLAQRGLVERVSDPGDRRVRIARITSPGKKLVESLLPHHYQAINAMCADLDDSEKAALGRLLTRLRTSVSRQAGARP